jgi:protein associated with RNAse G/E
VPAEHLRFTPGQVIVRRYWTQNRLSFMKLTTVIADDEYGLRLWLSEGSPYWRIVAPDGRTEHDATIEELGPDAELEELTWNGTNLMIWIPPGANRYSVWWFFDAENGEFDHWYVNLESPTTRFSTGVDSSDHALDIRAYPGGNWKWKDEGELAARTGQPGYWTAEQAAAVRAEGERLTELIKAGKFPFDGTWCDIRRPQQSPPLERPPGWDGPRAV